MSQDLRESFGEARHETAPDAAFSRSRFAGHFVRLWQGRPSLSRIFWSDMLIGGTAISMTATLLGYLLMAADAPGAVSLAVWLAPLPYSLLLVAAVWKSARGAKPEWASLARLASLGWLVVVTIV